MLYHSITDKPGQYSETPATFKNQMFTLKQQGYTTLTIQQYESFLAGTYKPPAKSVVITFDDGTNSAYDNTDPLFQALGFHATDFIITKYSIEKGGSHYYLSPSAIKTMSKSGRWDIEAHTDAGHTQYQISQDGQKGDFYSNKLWLSSKNRMETDQEYAARVNGDMTSAKHELSSLTGVQPTAFAFPFGDYGQDTVNYPAGQQILLTSLQKEFKVGMMQYYPGRGNSQEYYGDNSLVARRIEVTPSWTGSQLLADIQLGASKQASFKDDFSHNKGWRQTSGNAAISNGTMQLNTSSPRYGSTAAAALDGGFFWTNYSFTANMHLTGGQALTLTARNLSPDNYVSCEYSLNSLSVIQVQDGHRTILNSGAYTLDPTDTGNYGITVENNMVGCTLNGQLMAIGTSRACRRPAVWACRSGDRKPAQRPLLSIAWPSHRHRRR